jgi:hypothetical protein
VKRKPEAVATRAFYVYLIGRAAEVARLISQKSAPVPMETDASLESVTEGALAAVFSTVPIDKYGEGQFEEKLKDPQWVAEKVMRHQAVAAYFSEDHPIIPLRFGVMYSQLKHLSTMLAERQKTFTAALDRVEGSQEWALNIYVDKAALAGKLRALSPKLAELDARAKSASPGQAYLLEKQVERLHASEMKAYLKRAADQIATELEPQALESKRMSVSDLESKQERPVAGKVIYLVKKSKLRSFKAAAQKLAQKHAESGFLMELTGPWPPYNFIE